jgi:hypothetical protein
LWQRDLKRRLNNNKTAFSGLTPPEAVFLILPDHGAMSSIIKGKSPGKKTTIDAVCVI